MATYGVLVEHDADGYTAWAPVIPGAYGYGSTKADAMRHVAEAVTALLATEPEGLADLDDEREVIGVEAHLLEITAHARPRVRTQRLGSLSEIAGALGVSRQTAWNWTRRHEGFPVPLAQTAAGPVWSLREVKAWARAHKLRGGTARSA
ncbi:MAG: helix-turn-helix domain-containing protein [Actinomycetota bacterium]